MNGWFFAIILLNVMNLGIYLAKHGQPKDEKFNFFGAVIGAGIQLTLIYMAIKTGL